MAQDDKDIWTNLPRATDAPGAVTSPQVQRIDGLYPDAGADNPKATAHDVLSRILWADLDKPHVYALVDPALAFGILERLADSELTYRCLHRAPDSNDMAAAYPWLIHLPADAIFLGKFCSNLHGGDWWGEEPAIFLRSGLDFDKLWSHLRKSHRVQDANGAWLFLRFWDPELLVRMIETDLPAARALLRADTDIIARFDTTAAVITWPDAPLARPMGLQEGDVQKIGNLRTGRRHRGIVSHLRHGFPEELADKDDATLMHEVTEALDAADRVGLRGGESRAKFVIMSTVTVPGLDKDRTTLAYLQRSHDPDQALRDLNDVIRSRIGAIAKEELA